MTDDGTFTDAVSKISWVATGPGMPPGAFDLFTVMGDPMPKASKLTFRAVQTYSNGDVVRWIEIPTKGAPAPDHPAPTLTIMKAKPGS